MGRLTWGVDGYGRRYYLCKGCGKHFGVVKDIFYERLVCECSELCNERFYIPESLR